MIKETGSAVGDTQTHYMLHGNTEQMALSAPVPAALSHGHKKLKPSCVATRRCYYLEGCYPILLIQSMLHSQCFLWPVHPKFVSSAHKQTLNRKHGFKKLECNLVVVNNCEHLIHLSADKNILNN